LVFSDPVEGMHSGYALPKLLVAVGSKTLAKFHFIPEGRFEPDDIDAIGFVVDVTGVDGGLIRFSCIAPSGPPGQLVASTEIPSSFVAFRGSGISPVPPMPTIPEPGIRPVLPVPLEEEENPVLSVPLRDGAIRAGLSAPMQGADGRVPADTMPDVDPIGLAVPSPPSSVAPRGLSMPAIADAAFDDEVPVVAVEQAVETLEIPDVDTPDIGNDPDSPVSPPPSKVELLLDDAAGHGGAMDSVPTLSGDSTPIPGAPPIRLVCSKPGPLPNRSSQAVSDRNSKVTWQTLQTSCHAPNNDPSPRDIALPSTRASN
jgi:hypothetical protein